MLTAFFYSARLYVTLCLQSLQRRKNLGQLSWRGRLLRVLLFIAFLPVWLLHWLCLFLDELLFPGYRKIELKRPLFILGVPRSGTTFLHRSLSEDRQRFSSVSTWEVFLAPSILQKRLILGLAAVDRWLGKPGARLLGWLEKKLFAGLEGVHDVSLEAAEEDYLLLLPLFSCFILFLPFTESRHIWQLARFDWEASARDKRIIMNFYTACLKKHMAVFGKDKRYLSKNAAFASWPQTLYETFPDADFVICMREPERAVPSLLGSLRSGADFFELDLDQGELPQMLVEMMDDYYRHLLENFPVQAPIIHMDALKRNVGDTIVSLYQSFGDEISKDYRQQLQELINEASQYRTRTNAIQPASGTNSLWQSQGFSCYYRLCQQAEAGTDSSGPSS